LEEKGSLWLNFNIFETKLGGKRIRDISLGKNKALAKRVKLKKLLWNDSKVKVKIRPRQNPWRLGLGK